jgi:hypothetical protein
MSRAAPTTLLTSRPPVLPPLAPAVCHVTTAVAGVFVAGFTDVAIRGMPELCVHALQPRIGLHIASKMSGDFIQEAGTTCWWT